ncbi:MAG: hypothetical protein EBS49_08760 [Verrucomicrobia bacterium]|nr:hypothetical protein [Verrucomicrobiota bacterium]NBU69679.1 hypothetical protein [Verrucomicrobiota bacterium]
MQVSYPQKIANLFSCFLYFQYFKYFRRLGDSLVLRFISSKNHFFGVKNHFFGVKNHFFGVKNHFFFKMVIDLITTFLYKW